MFQTIDYPKTLLFDVLGHYGYETALFSSQNENWQGMRRFLLTNSKIDTFFHSPDALGENIKIETKLDDAFTRQKAQEFIASRSSAKPLFLALNFQRTHFPYSLNSKEPGPYQPTDIQGKFAFFNYSPKEAPNVINKFDNALRYVDSQVGIFIQFLKKQGLYDDAIILVMPDHGEAFYQNGFPTHGTTLYDAQVKTFLLIKTPQSKLRGEKTETISLIDINPSVLALLGLPNHPNFQGVDIIFEKYENRPIFMTAQGIIPADGVVVYPWKFIRCLKMGEKLINAKIDPSEMVDFSSQFPEIRKTLENMLNSYIHTQMTYYNCLSNKYYQPKF
jgi:arylsulfatase A-like enzyme